MRPLGQADVAELPPNALAAMLQAYGTADASARQTFLRKRGHVFFSYTDWIDFIKAMSFCIGTRVHGTRHFRAALVRREATRASREDDKFMLHNDL
jgi:hypothetical protein